MEQKKNNHTGIKILGGALVIGIGAYVVNEVRKEYDSTVAENNYLKNFINDHDFYKKESLPKLSSYQNLKQNKPSENKFAFTSKKRTPTSSYVREDGNTVNEYYDTKSGFTVIELVSNKENEKANEA